MPYPGIPHNYKLQAQQLLITFEIFSYYILFYFSETKNFVDLLFTTLENKNYHIVKGDPEFTKTTGESEEINSSSPKPSTNLEIPPDDTQVYNFIYSILLLFKL